MTTANIPRHQFRRWMRERLPRSAGLRGPGPILLAAALVAGACGTSTPRAAPSASPSPTGIQIAPELLGPLTMLGPCSPVTDPNLDQDVPGLDLPESAFLLEVTEQNGLVNVRGYVAMTPIVFQLGFRERKDLEMITVENEIQESETLYSDGERRVFLKAAAVCELGSVFIAAIADDVAAEKVPTPSGSPTPQG